MLGQERQSCCCVVAMPAVSAISATGTRGRQRQAQQGLQARECRCSRPSFPPVSPLQSAHSALDSAQGTQPPQTQQTCLTPTHPEQVQTANAPQPLPPHPLPLQGKSSLLNALFGRKVAVTSRRAGRTRSLNLFRSGERFRLVDVPGYGHGSRVQFMEAVGDYIAMHVPRADTAVPPESMDDTLAGAGSPPAAERRAGPPCAAMLLLDSRRGLSEPDSYTLSLLAEAQVPLRIILTKADQLTLPQLRNTVRLDEAAGAARQT